MKIYTRTGDGGDTGLFGGKRISKSQVRIHAYGSIDELNAALGIVLAEGNLPQNIAEQLADIQRLLFLVGADLATPLDAKVEVPRVHTPHIKRLEQWIDDLDGTLPQLKSFIVPSGSKQGAQLHLARTICRRAERWIVTLMEQEKINHDLLTCVNRLGDYLFVCARTVNKHHGNREDPVDIRNRATREA